MASTAQDGVTKIDRSYVDNFAVKEFARDTLMEAYFPDSEISTRSVGMIGFTTEQISNITEDVFNTGSVYFREMYPNRAEIDESIYSHAAIFQLTDIFSSPCSCRFLIVLEESAIDANMTYDKDSGYYYFYIDKNTTVYVEEIPFVLDYDIELKIAKKRGNKKEEFIYTAKYIHDNLDNSMSDIEDPYIKLRIAGGFLALEVTMHQYERDVIYESIVNNSRINYPVIDIPFEGQICGFDILYKRPTDSDYVTQMRTLPVYSQPITQPFCYYQMKDSSTIRITFNSKDSYFMPEFNSEVKIILYKTLGESGSFEVYRGTNIHVDTNYENYQYDEKFVMSAKPLGASEGGMSSTEMEALRAFTVEGYRTALALTTDNDLQEYFNNFVFRYGDASIMFTKLRNDIRERIYSAFVVMKYDDHIFKTNCMNISMNLAEMSNPETNVYTLEPGSLFIYNEASLTEGKLFEADFLRDEELRQKLWNEYQEAIANGEIDYIPDGVDKSELPGYLDRPASFAEFKKRKGIDDKLTIFDVPTETLQEFDNPEEGKFLYTNPFLIRFKKNPNLVNLFFPFVDERATLEFTDQNEDAYVQFIHYWVDIRREFEKKKRYVFTTEVSSNIDISIDKPIIDTLPDLTDPLDPNYGVTRYIVNDEFNVVNNDLRVILIFSHNKRDIAFTEMVPTDYIVNRKVFTFSAEIRTDDHLTSDGRIRFLEDIKYRDEDTGDYYMVTNDNTIYTKYDYLGNVLETDVPVDTVFQLLHDGKLKRWDTIKNMTGNDDILVPITECTVRIETLYRRIYDEEAGNLVLATTEQTNNKFVAYDSSLDTYIWTNRYQSLPSETVLMQPLDYVRSDLVFYDYTARDKDGKYFHDIMDVRVRSIPLVKWDLPLDQDYFPVFSSRFLYYYNWIVDIINTRLRNVTAIDVKWYNTYGRSKNYAIGDEEEIINTINLKMKFDMWFLPGTDILNEIERIKYFIKGEVEQLNEDCVNFVHMSNLMRKIELNFASVDHIRFLGINNYPTNYQSVKVLVEDINELEKADRMVYVPEMLTIDLENILINPYTVDSI